MGKSIEIVNYGNSIVSESNEGTISIVTNGQASGIEWNKVEAALKYLQEFRTDQLSEGEKSQLMDLMHATKKKDPSKLLLIGKRIGKNLEDLIIQIAGAVIANMITGKST